MTMSLYYSPTSPYARKVRVVAQELGIAGRIELIASPVSPVELNEAVAGHNPLAKVPTLAISGGGELYDSRVICAYLLSLVPEQTLLPPAGALHWDVLRRQALADGLLDAALLARYEEALRPAEFRWPAWQAGQEDKVRRALRVLEREAGELDSAPRLDGIAIACALGYLDLRFGRFAWREGAPNLAAFEARFAQRPAMLETRPP